MNFWGLLLATFVITVDASALELVLPKLAVALDASLEQASLISTVYLFALNLTMVPAAAATRRLSANRLFNLGIALLSLGSLVSALAWRIEPLIIGRLLLGVGAGAVAGVSSIIIYQRTLPQDRHAVFARIGIVIALGYLIGPPMGGVLFQTLGWPTIFLFNVPLIAVICLWRKPSGEPLAAPSSSSPIPSPTASPLARTMDYKGLVAITVLIAGLFIVLQPLRNLGGQETLRALGAAAMALGAYFVWRLNRTAADPVVDLNLFLYNRQFASIVVGSFASYAGAFVIAFITPFYVTNAMNLDAMTLGLLLTTFPLGFLTGSFLGGVAGARLGSRTATLLAQAIVLASVGPMLMLDGSSPAWQIALTSTLVGLARGLFVSPIITYGMEVVAEHQISQVGALLGLVRNLGTLLGTLCASTLFAALLGGKAIADVRASDPQLLFSCFRWVYVASFAWAALALLVMVWPPRRRPSSSTAPLEADVGF